MKRLHFILALLLALCVSVVQAQVSVETTSGLTAEVTGGLEIALDGNWSNNGTLTAGNGTILLNGSGLQTITNASGAFHHLTINKVSGDVQAAGNFTVDGTFTLTGGGVDLNGNVITLGTNALLAETAGNTVKGASGYITTTRDLNAPSSDNVGGLGFEITSAANLGSTVIQRGHAVQSGNGNQSILRYFDVTPTTNSGLNATVVYRYDESELNGQTETALQLYRSTDGGGSWFAEGGAVDAGANSLTQSGIDDFSRWTAADQSLVSASANSFMVTNTADIGAGSLRQAILDANLTPNLDSSTPDTIKFNIAGTGPHTIQPLSALPDITDPVIIDGTTEPDANCDAWPPTLAVELDGTNAGATNGLTLTAGGSTVRGLVINRFDGNGIGISTTGGNTVECNFIGTDVNGTTDLGNASDGIDIDGVPNNTIGGTTAGARNLISGNNNRGVEIRGNAATGNLVQGNFIGTDVNGTADLGNERHGVFISGAPGNTIGGTVVDARNIISGNNGAAGVGINGNSSTGNLVQGNFIGTDVNGTADLGNEGHGVIINGAPGNTIGGTVTGARNIISGNNDHGVEISSGSGNLVQGNFIGTDVNGSAGLGNNISGISLGLNSANNVIGGSADGAGNTIAFNNYGVILVGETGNAILGNSIHSNGGLGIDLGGDLVPTLNDAGDGDSGPNGFQNFPVLTSAETDGSASVTITGTFNSTPGTNDFRLEFFSNAVCNGDQNGDPHPTYDYGEGETFLGLTTVNTDSSGDASFSVMLPAAVPAGAFITATATAPDNSTSEFSQCVQATVSASANSFMVTNTADIGAGSLRQAILDANATTNIDASTPDIIKFDIPTSDAGYTGSYWSIQPTSELPDITEAVIIDGITQPGADCSSWPPTLLIELNGSNAGSVSGLTLSIGGSDGSTIRGLVINEFRVGIVPVSTNNRFECNFIGTDVTGTLAKPNRQGFEFRGAASGNTVGGSTEDKRNLISGNGGAILFDGGGSNIVQGNYIGTDVTGTLPLGNSGAIATIKSGQLIGGTGSGEGNIIAFNEFDGVFIDGGPVSNRILGNSIHSNGGLGIDLGLDGVTANDAGDGDAGPNNYQNFPVLTSAETDGSASVTITGTFNSTPGTNDFRLEFFANTVCNGDVNGDPQADDYGEGETFLGFTTVNTDASGDASFSVTLPSAVPVGAFITATATAPDNSTSEFSQCVQAAAIVAVSSDSLDFTQSENSTGSDTLTMYNSGTEPLDWTATSQESASGDGQLSAKPASGEAVKILRVNGTYSLPVEKAARDLTAKKRLIGAEKQPPASRMEDLFYAQQKAADSGFQALLPENTAPTGSGNCDWLSVDPSGGTIAPGDSVKLTVTVDAAGLAPGTYRCEFTIVRNDPFTELLSVPVTLVVEATPPISTVLLATNSIWLHQGAAILSGDVVVNDTSAGLAGPYLEAGVELSIDGYATTPAGSALKAHRIRIDPNAVIDSDVFYNELDNRGTLNGSENTPLDLPVFAALPPFVTAPAGTGDVIVPKNGTQSLSPGDYGLVQVERGAVLTLDGGIYNLRELVVKRSAQVQFAAAGEIRIEGRFTADRQTFLGPADEAGIDAADIIIYVKGINGATGTLDDMPKAAAVAQNSSLEANLYAPNGTLMLEMGSSASGSFIARDIQLEGNTEVSFNGAFFPGNPASLAKLNDGNNLTKLAALPETYELQQNYPNPFNPTTTIRIALPEAAKVTLEIYNILGQKVRALISGSMEAGYHQIQWDGANDYGARVASGMYLYKLQADNFVEVKKMILMK